MPMGADQAVETPLHHTVNHAVVPCSQILAQARA
jgi:hypothetical protein